MILQRKFFEAASVKRRHHIYSHEDTMYLETWCICEGIHCTETHARHIFFEPAVQLNCINRVDDCRSVVANHILELVVGEDLIKD